MRKTVYHADEVKQLLDFLERDHNVRYEAEGNDENFHFRGFSPRETMWRLEPYVPILMECPNKYYVHVRQTDGSWLFVRKPNA